MLPHFGKAHSLMIRIVSDTSTMYSTKQAREAGLAVSPLAVTIAGRSGRELDEMSPDDFVSIIAKGHMPKKRIIRSDPGRMLLKEGLCNAGGGCV